MASTLKKTLFLTSLMFAKLVIGQSSSLSTIQKASYDEVANFFKSNKQYITTVDKWTKDCNNIFSGNFHKWSYALAKAQTFKAIDQSQQQYFDSIATIVLTEIGAANKPITAVYFPELKGSNKIDEQIVNLQTDLYIKSIDDNENISVIRYWELEKKFQNSDEFTLCEYLGNMTNNEALTLGNTIFIKKGLLNKDDLSAIITFFNNLRSDLKSKGNINDIKLAVNFKGKRSNYAGLFKIRNGNLVGELHPLNATANFTTLTSKDLAKLSPKGEVYVISNNKSYDTKGLQKNLAEKGVTLKKLKEFSPPSKIYSLEIKTHGGSSKKYEKIDLAEVKKQLEDNNINCGLAEVCVQSNPNVDFTLECKVGENSVSVKISTEASIEFTLKSSDGSSNSISFDKEGKMKITSSYEQK
jgi:hypothetical protein